MTLEHKNAQVFSMRIHRLGRVHSTDLWTIVVTIVAEKGSPSVQLPLTMWKHSFRVVNLRLALGYIIRRKRSCKELL